MEKKLSAFLNSNVSPSINGRLCNYSDQTGSNKRNSGDLLVFTKSTESFIEAVAGELK